MANLAILNDVGFTNGYDHVIDFDSVEAQTEYFNAKVATTLTDTENEYKFIRPNYEVKVALPYNRLIGYNYCYFENTLKGVKKRFYAFITSIEYINPETTRLLLQVDVMQTFMFDYELGECYVDREHQDRVKLIGDTQVAVYSTTDEGVDYGKDYFVKSQKRLFDWQTPNERLGGFGWVFINTTEPLEGHTPNSIGSAFGVRTPIYTYVTAIEITHDMLGAVRYDTDNLGDRYASLDMVMAKLGKDPKVISIVLTPYSPFKLLVKENIYTDDEGNKTLMGYQIRIFNAVDLDLNGFKVMYLDNQRADISDFLTSTQKEYLYLFNKSDFIQDYYNIGLEQPADIENETKLKTDPYLYYSLGNQQNQPKAYKNEYIENGAKVKYLQNIGPTTKERVYIEGYKDDENGYFECSLNNTNNDIPLKNDAYLNYIAQNKASSIAGVAVPIVSTIAGIGITALTGGAGAVVGGALIANGIVSIGTTIANDYAKKEDLKQTPDTVRSSGNNIVFDVLAGNFWYNITAFEIGPTAKERLYKYFMHYGYKCGNFKVPNVKSRYYYNYIRNLETTLITALDQATIQAIKNVYTAGVTFWHYHTADHWHGVGNYDYENTETALIEEGNV